MPVIIVYSTATCAYCVRAKQLLQSKGVSFQEVRIDLDDAKREEMMQRSGRRTVPQIFIGDYHVGGCDDLVGLNQAGKLDSLLEI